MSIECELCDSTIFVPDSVWYAGTLFSPRRVILCGCCASCIPIEERRTVTAVQPIDLTFGVVNAELDATRQWYSAAGAINGQARFAVTGVAVEKYLPNSDCMLKPLFPYFCMDWFVKDLVKDYVDKDKRSAAGRERAVARLMECGCAAREWLRQKKARESGTEAPMDTSIRKLEQSEAGALLDELVDVVGKGIQSD
jgi:hypothetical protein